LADQNRARAAGTAAATAAPAAAAAHASMGSIDAGTSGVGFGAAGCKRWRQNIGGVGVLVGSSALWCCYLNVLHIIGKQFDCA
jgi:hypothetical protein